MTLAAELPSEENPTCIKCGLWKNCRSPFMDAQGADNPKVLIIGEAPGEDEDKQGKPFVGKSGQLLRQVLAEVGYSNEDVKFTNIVRCRPPNNKLDNKSIEYCRDFAVRDIEASKSEYVFLMGNSPLSGILGESGITNWNGVLIQSDGHKFLPLYHPAYILRDPSKLDDWLKGFLTASDGEEAQQEAAYDYIFPMTVKEIDEMYERLDEVDEISTDVETNKLIDAFSDDSRLLAISFAAEGVAYSLPIEHPESWWTAKELVHVKKVVKKILARHNGCLTGHNIKFDLMWIAAQLKLQLDAQDDTMLISQLVDSTLGVHGLKKLASVYLGMYHYDKELEDYKHAHKEADPKRGGTYANIPLSILLPYSAMDSEATHKLRGKLLPQLSEKQLALYNEVIIPVSNVLTKLQVNGLAVDDFLAKRYEAIYSDKRQAAYRDILADPKVQRYVSTHQAELDAVAASKPTKSGKPRAAKKYKFNPGSTDQRAELYFKFYKIPKLAISKKTGKPSTAGKLYRPLEPKYPILGKIRYYNLLGKMLSTYLRPVARVNTKKQVVSTDCRVHTTYNIGGAKTGRLSSSEPMNLQNIPTPEKEPGTLLEWLPVKNVFTHSMWPGTSKQIVIAYDIFQYGGLVQADYSGMELRIFASLAKCWPMIAIHKTGLDFHRMIAALSLHMVSIEDVLQAKPEELAPIIAQISKEVRYRYKWTNWTLLYGGSAHTLHRLYDVPLKEAEQTIEDYYTAFPEVPVYLSDCREFAEEHGYIESPLGRREHLPYINDSDRGRREASVREAVNMPVQSTASDCLLMAAIVIDDKMTKASMRSLLVNTVHDSILGDCPPEEIVPFGELCQDVMGNLKSYAVDYMPSIDMDWLICPIKADIEVGTHYGTKVDLEDWRKEYEHAR